MRLTAMGGSIKDESEKAMAWHCAASSRVGQITFFRRGARRRVEEKRKKEWRMNSQEK
jgi:hypothetical protein